MSIVRYADDLIVGFEREADARRFFDEMRLRIEAFGLLLHPEKTRLIEFWRFAAQNRKRRGLGRAAASGAVFNSKWAVGLLVGLKIFHIAKSKLNIMPLREICDDAPGTIFFSKIIEKSWKTGAWDVPFADSDEGARL